MCADFGKNLYGLTAHHLYNHVWKHIIRHGKKDFSCIFYFLFSLLEQIMKRDALRRKLMTHISASEFSS